MKFAEQFREAWRGYILSGGEASCAAYEKFCRDHGDEICLALLREAGLLNRLGDGTQAEAQVLPCKKCGTPPVDRPVELWPGRAVPGTWLVACPRGCDAQSARDPDGDNAPWLRECVVGLWNSRQAAA